MPLNAIGLMVDKGGNPVGLPPAPEWIDQRNITAGSPEDIAVPNGAAFVIFASEVNFYVKPNAGAINRPTGDLADGTAWDINPVGYCLVPLSGVAIATLRVDTGSSGIVAAKFYKNGR